MGGDVSMNSNEDRGAVQEKTSNQAIKGERVEKGLTSNAKPSVALVEESKCLGLLKETIWARG